MSSIFDLDILIKFRLIELHYKYLSKGPHLDHLVSKSEIKKRSHSSLLMWEELAAFPHYLHARLIHFSGIIILK